MVKKRMPAFSARRKEVIRSKALEFCCHKGDPSVSSVEIVASGLRKSSGTVEQKQ